MRNPYDPVMATPHSQPRFQRIAARAAGWVCLCVVVCIAAGCQANRDLLSAQQMYRQGNVDLAQRYVDQYIKNEGKKDINHVIAHLEQGTIRAGLDDRTGSNESLQIAEDAINVYDEQPDISLSKEALAAVTNLNSLPYRGYHSDRVMLSTLRAINDLILGDHESARVNLNRALQRQRDAVQDNADKLVAVRDLAQTQTESTGDATVEKAQQDPKFQASLERHYGNLSKYRAYAVYVNPFTEWLQGLYFLSNAADGSDRERARKSLQRVAGMLPNNTFVQEDYALAERVVRGEPLPELTYVIFATGTAPRRAPVRIDIPLFLFNDEVDYFGINFPKLAFHNNYLQHVEVRTGTTTAQSQVVGDMDAIIAHEFEQELPLIITKTLIASGTKAAIAYALNQATQGDSTTNDIVRIASVLYQASVNQADLRTWASLPKQYQVARVLTPNDRIIQLVLPGQGGAPIEITLRPATINVVLVRSIQPAAPLQITQFTLGKELDDDSIPHTPDRVAWLGAAADADRLWHADRKHR